MTILKNDFSEITNEETQYVLGKLLLSIGEEKFSHVIKLLSEEQQSTDPLVETVRKEMNRLFVAAKTPFLQAVLNWTHVLKFEEVVKEKAVQKGALKMWSEWLTAERYSQEEKEQYMDLVKAYLILLVRNGISEETMFSFL